jgi:hypothetical protein
MEAVFIRKSLVWDGGGSGGGTAGKAHAIAIGQRGKQVEDESIMQAIGCHGRVIDG